MRLFLHALRVICYICAFICLFNGAAIVGYDGGEVAKFFIDFGMAAGCGLLGLVFSYILHFILKKPTENVNSNGNSDSGANR